MNFRWTWVGSDHDSDGNPLAGESAAPILHRGTGSTTYEVRGTEMVRREQRSNGRSKVIPVANFTARIVRDLVVEDDTAVSGREFVVEVECGGQRLTFQVPAAEFARMTWVLNKLGPQAIIYPGQQQHTRAAIQCLSNAIGKEHIFTHLGWRRQGDWVYLQAGGALGAKGLRSDLQVQLPAALQHYRVKPPADAGERVAAIRASLRFLSLASDRITFPLLAAVYRAPLGKVDFSLFLAGPSGAFKTALAALCQQHFGAEMDARAMPGHFDSTGNALEELAFLTKDALLVVDDFVPTGGTGDGALHGTAERLFRGAGNQQGRSRISGHGQLQASRPPRALILATGEEVPRGQSLRARLLIVELRPAEVDRKLLTECQGAAQRGQLAAAMAGFLSWIAERYEEVQQRLQTRMRELRSRVLPYRCHARLPAALAELQSGWEIWLQFALEAGAIGVGEQIDLAGRCSKALDDVARLQAQHQPVNNPALRFVALLQAALVSGRAHVAGRKGGAPEAASLWGWKSQPAGSGWVPCGVCIGWLAGSDLYLNSTASYSVAREAAGREPLMTSEQTLRHRLHQHGLLVSIDTARHTLLVRRTLDRSPRHVLHLNAGDLVATSIKESGS